MSSAQGVAALAGVDRFERAYQSAGRTPEPWIGPDIGEFVRERAAAGVKRFLVVPVGFVCDHTEVLFDIDVQAKTAAEASGASLRRTESLNSSPTFIAMLEDLVQSHL
jgi:ferrochelatase